MPKITGLSEITNPEPGDILAGVDDSADTTKYIKIGTLLKLIYPIGSLYMNKTDETSPATLFGFGTWARIQGRTIVAISDTDPDFAEGSTGGQKEVQAHAHGVNDPAHAHGVYDPGHSHSTQGTYLRDVGGGGNIRNPGSGSVFQGLQNVQVNGSGSNIGIYASGTGISIQNTGSGSNNMNPYDTAYVWERTA